MLTAERQDRRQIVLQLALGAVAGIAGWDLGKVRPPVREKELARENMLTPSCRRGSSPVAYSFWGRKNVFTQSGPKAKVTGYFSP
jgi:hypothetical protein